MEKMEMEFNAECETSTTPRGILSHVLDWAFIEGMNVNDLKQNLEKEIKNIRFKLDETLFINQTILEEKEMLNTEIKKQKKEILQLKRKKR
jgi:hypothetical protein